MNLSIKDSGILLSWLTAKRGSHMPVLSQFVPMTSGPILEMGCGGASTPFLHWLCYPTKRRLVTVESALEFATFLDGWTADFHETICTPDLDSVDLSQPWGVAFVDHAPPERRAIDIARLVHADYVIVHDSENSSEHKYHYSRAFRLFKYRYKYTAHIPYTSILSNKHDLSNVRLI